MKKSIRISNDLYDSAVICAEYIGIPTSKWIERAIKAWYKSGRQDVAKSKTFIIATNDKNKTPRNFNTDLNSDDLTMAIVYGVDIAIPNIISNCTKNKNMEKIRKESCIIH